MIAGSCRLDALWEGTEKGYTQGFQLSGHRVVHLYLRSVDLGVEFEKLGILFFLSLRSVAIVGNRTSDGLAGVRELPTED